MKVYLAVQHIKLECIQVWEEDLESVHGPGSGCTHEDFQSYDFSIILIEHVLVLINEPNM